jgi:hypothetical protein
MPKKAETRLWAWLAFFQNLLRNEEDNKIVLRSKTASKNRVPYTLTVSTWDYGIPSICHTLEPIYIVQNSSRKMSIVTQKPPPSLSFFVRRNFAHVFSLEAASKFSSQDIFACVAGCLEGILKWIRPKRRHKITTVNNCHNSSTNPEKRLCNKVKGLSKQTNFDPSFQFFQGRITHLF